MSNFIPCENCHKQFIETWHWYTCDKCGFRICPDCLSKHKGQYGEGFKCSRCAYGHMESNR